MQEPTNVPAGTPPVRWGRWALVLFAVGILILRGMLATGSILGQANLVNVPIATAVLPTLPPTQKQITPEEYANDLLVGMTLSDKIAQMLVMDLAGPTLTPEQQQMVQQQHVGGALAFGTEIVNAQQVLKLTHDLQQYAYRPLFTAIDEEGGSEVPRLESIVGSRPGEAQIGMLNDPRFAKQAGVQTSQDLVAYGFNLNLAPVVDIQEPNVDNTGLAGRLYSSEPNVIANMANAYLQGLQQSHRIIGTLKHFPGLGASATNPDFGLATVNKSQAQLDAHEFVPYRKLIAGGNVHAIMVTHILLPQIDATAPATLSYPVITGLLRNDLGYQGLIITDDLRTLARSSFANLTIAQDAVMTIAAGSDLVMGPINPAEVTSIISAVTTAIANGQLTEARIDDSVRRIFVEKIKMGLIPLPKITPTSTPTSPAAPLATLTPMATKPSH